MLTAVFYKMRTKNKANQKSIRKVSSFLPQER